MSKKLTLKDLNERHNRLVDISIVWLVILTIVVILVVMFLAVNFLVDSHNTTRILNLYADVDDVENIIFGLEWECVEWAEVYSVEFLLTRHPDGSTSSNLDEAEHIKTGEVCAKETAIRRVD